jgi:putative spermidine/putrescine transport system permease protein
MELSRPARWLLRLGTAITLAFLYAPLLVIALYAFNSRRTLKWPIPGLTFAWFDKAFHNPGVREALWTSVKAGLGATAIALVLGTMTAFAVHRFQFFGRQAISFALVLPIALPGIVTAMTLNSAINVAGIPFSLKTIIVGHATFCVVVVFNNVIARLRRTPTSLVEASMDLGADGWQTFRLVTFPVLRAALLAGGLLAFALSLDEIVVTNFTSGSEITLPKWIFDNLRQPRNRPVVNVVAVVIVVLSLVPVYLAQRLTRETGGRITAARNPGSGAQ